VNPRLLCLDESDNFWGPPVGIVTVLYAAHYIVGILVTGVPSEARYSLTSFYNML
jgi:hypothetical protein